MNYKIVAIVFAVFTLILNAWLPYESDLVETYYSSGLFQMIRYLHDYTFGLLPFPSVYLLLTFLILGLMFYIKNFKRRHRDRAFGTKLVKFAFDLVLLFSFVIILFYWLWGFNYKRHSFEKKNELEKVEISEEWLFAQLSTVHNKLNSLSEEMTFTFDHSKTEILIREVMNAELPELGYGTAGKVRIRALNPKGNLLIWSTAGVYLPFVSEGHIDAGLPSLTKPFTMAHEMTHGYGEGNESTCNFVGFLACIRAKDESIQYSGWLGYFRYLLSSCKRTNPEKFTTFYNEELSDHVKSDLRSIYKELEKYPDILPKLRYMLYDSYLKSHGVKEGMLSYSRMIHLAARWEAKHGGFTSDRSIQDLE